MNSKEGYMSSPGGQTLRKASELSQSEKAELIKIYKQDVPIARIIQRFRLTNAGALYSVLHQTQTPLRGDDIRTAISQQGESQQQIDKEVAETLTGFRRGRDLSHAEMQRVVELYANDTPVAEITDVFSLNSFYGVYEVLRKMGYKHRRRNKHAPKQAEKNGKPHNTRSAKKFLDWEKQAVRKDYDAGMTCKQLQEKYKISSYSGVYDVLRSTGCTFSNKPKPAAQPVPAKAAKNEITVEQKVCKDYLKGKPTRQIQDKYRISNETMYYFLEQNNIPRRRVVGVNKRELRTKVSRFPKAPITFKQRAREWWKKFCNFWTSGN